MTDAAIAACVHEAFARLTVQLQQQHPRLAMHLRAGLSPAAILGQLQHFPYILPDDVVAWYQEHNGFELDDQGSGELFPDWEVLSLEEGSRS